MDRKKILQEFCSDLEKDLNQREGTGKEKRVELFSGLKPSDYFLPTMHIGTSKSIPVHGVMSWFVEVIVDGKVVFRESYVPKKSDDTNVIEGFLIRRVLRNIFTFGVMSSKQFIENAK